MARGGQSQCQRVAESQEAAGARARFSSSQRQSPSVDDTRASQSHSQSQSVSKPVSEHATIRYDTILHLACHDTIRYDIAYGKQFTIRYDTRIDLGSTIRYDGVRSVNAEARDSREHMFRDRTIWKN